MKIKFKHSLIFSGLLLLVFFKSFTFIINNFFFIILFLVLSYPLIKLLKKKRIYHKLLALEIFQKIINFLKLKYDRIVEWESKIINFIVIFFDKKLGKYLGKIKKRKFFKSIYNNNLLKIIKEDFKKNPSIYVIALVIVFLIIGLNFYNQNQLDKRNQQIQTKTNERVRKQQAIDERNRQHQLYLYEQQRLYEMRKCNCPGGGFHKACCP
tara:strand:- start:41 stop:670 length:630 start_codon:yes stop_codon:yes gene_type:complete